MSPLHRSRGRTWRALRVRAFVLLGLVLLVLATYAVVVVAGGVLLGRAGSPQLGLSVLATAVVALAFDPAQRVLEAVASRSVDGGRPAPYDVVRRFSETVAGRYPAEELPARMARVLADATDAQWAQVWVTVGGNPTLAATWPPEAATAAPGAGAALAASDVGRSMPVRHSGELLGALVVRPRDGVSLTSVEERLFAELAGQAGLALRGMALRALLGRRATELTTRADELWASRQRLVDAQDEARRRLERDVHDGAQQHLVALSVNLRLAHTLATASPGAAASLLTEQRQAAVEAIATIDRLSQGIYPPVLIKGGLTAALTYALAASLVPVTVQASGVGRYPADIEAAAYFCVLEAVQNAVKHSGAPVVRLSLTGRDGSVLVEVADEGAGFDPRRTDEGAGLGNMRDRVESMGGTLTVDTTLGRGSRIRIWLPTTTVPAPRADV